MFLDFDRPEENIFEGQSLKLFRIFRISGFGFDAVVAAAAAAAPVAVIHAALSVEQKCQF